MFRPVEIEVFFRAVQRELEVFVPLDLERTS